MEQELLRLGISGVVCIILYVMLTKSEKREEKKDARIQLLENQLRESYDERVEAASQISTAIHDSARSAENAAKAIESLTAEIKRLKDE